MLTKTLSITLLASAIAVTVVAAGCNSSKDSAKPVSASIVPADTGQSGAQLWADNCSRCHNIRPPDYYSDAQWTVVVHHMRLRANLTGEESRKITEFLQASN
jgi:mono/diheme cytochrome c family protein